MRQMIILACAVGIGLSILVIFGAAWALYDGCYAPKSGIGPAWDTCAGRPEFFSYSLIIFIPIIGIISVILVAGVKGLTWKALQ